MEEFLVQPTFGRRLPNCAIAQRQSLSGRWLAQETPSGTGLRAWEHRIPNDVFSIEPRKSLRKRSE